VVEAARLGVRGKLDVTDMLKTHRSPFQGVFESWNPSAGRTGARAKRSGSLPVRLSKNATT